MYGFPAGGAGDAMARRVAEKMGGTPTPATRLVENKPGAGGRIARRDAAEDSAGRRQRDAADALVDAPRSTPTSTPSSAYKPLEDVMPVSHRRATSCTTALASAPRCPPSVKTLKDFLAWAKANPAQGQLRLAGRRLDAAPDRRAARHAHGVELKHMPYRGSVPGITDLVGGQIAAMSSPERRLPANHQGRQAAPAGDLRQEALALLARRGDLRRAGLPGTDDRGVVRLLRAGEDACLGDRRRQRRHQRGDQGQGRDRQPGGGRPGGARLHVEEMARQKAPSSSAGVRWSRRSASRPSPDLPQASRTSCRCANPLTGGNTSGPAKPVPRCSWHDAAQGCADVLRGARRVRLGRA